VIPEKVYENEIHYHAASPGERLIRVRIKLNLTGIFIGTGMVVNHI
jgi:hypothetical protein